MSSRQVTSFGYQGFILASITTGGSAMAGPFLWGLLAATLGFSLLFGGVVLARMRALLADIQAEARLRRKALEA